MLTEQAVRIPRAPAGPRGLEPAELAAAGLPERVAEMVRHAPAMYQKGYLRALVGRATPRQAIRACCLECSNWQRVEAASCGARGCPLWPLRPGQERGISGDSTENVAEVAPDDPEGQDVPLDAEDGPAA